MQQNSVPYIRKFGHQTRNALGRVKSVLDFLKPETFAQLDDEQREMVFDVLTRGIEGSERLVDRLVRAKVFAEEDLPTEKINVSDILNKVLEDHKDALVAKCMVLQTEIDDSVEIEQTEDIVHFALESLIENAYFYGVEGTVIEISLTQDGFGFRFEIENKTKDTDSLTDVGTAYFRSIFADEKTAGSGLSLYTIAQASKRFNGQLTMTKNDDRFKVVLCL